MLRLKRPSIFLRFRTDLEPALKKRNTVTPKAK